MSKEDWEKCHHFGIQNVQRLISDEPMSLLTWLKDFSSLKIICECLLAKNVIIFSVLMKAAADLVFLLLLSGH